MDILIVKLPLFLLSLFFHRLSFLVVFLNFLFCIIVQWINNVGRVSGAQQRDSAIHIQVSTLPQTLLSSRLPHNTEQNSLCYTIGPCCLSSSSAEVGACPSQLPKYPFPPSFLLVTISSFSKPVSQTLYLRAVLDLQKNWEDSSKNS